MQSIYSHKTWSCITPFSSQKHIIYPSYPESLWCLNFFIQTTSTQWWHAWSSFLKGEGGQPTVADVGPQLRVLAQVNYMPTTLLVRRGLGTVVQRRQWWFCQYHAYTCKILKLPNPITSPAGLIFYSKNPPAACLSNY